MQGCAHAGVFDLTLRDPSKTVTAFTEDPARQASTGTLTQLIRGWTAQGFTKDPPNAALVVDGAPKASRLDAREVHRPWGPHRLRPLRQGEPVRRCRRHADARLVDHRDDSLGAARPALVRPDITVDYSAENAVDQLYTDGKIAFLLPQTGVGGAPVTIANGRFSIPLP